MIDYAGYLVQGFFTGVGVAVANWFHEKKIVKYLDKIDNKNKRKTEEDGF